MLGGYVTGDKFLVFYERGDRVRLLCPIPELGLEVGALGVVDFVYVGDDIEFSVRFDRHRCAFDLNNLWWIEGVKR